LISVLQFEGGELIDITRLAAFPLVGLRPRGEITEPWLVHEIRFGDDRKTASRCPCQSLKGPWRAVVSDQAEDLTYRLFTVTKSSPKRSAG
jgi:hypothetical protein